MYYLCAPENKPGISSSFFAAKESHQLFICTYRIPVPPVFLFHASTLYKAVNLYFVKRFLKNLTPSFDVCIDFGSYQFYDNMDFVQADTKIFFPVDDHHDLKPFDRGCKHLFSISVNIVDKFKKAGYHCNFINHGLSEAFASVARNRLAHFTGWRKNGRIKAAYSGNLFIPFLNIPLFKKMIQENPDVEFQLFGSIKYDKKNPVHADWYGFLEAAENVTIHGFAEPSMLAGHLNNADLCLMCYKPDFKNYHGENSHKIFEYLSTGRVIVSTHITLYAGNDLLNMTGPGEDERLPELFSETIRQIGRYNNDDFAKRRMQFSIHNTYAKQIERIEQIIAGRV
ncbi:MAG: hypothetical protein WKF97_11045 [Chitinophagaceae bacterium]